MNEPTNVTVNVPAISYNTKTNFDRLMNECKELESFTRTFSMSAVANVLKEYNISPGYVRTMLTHQIKSESKMIEDRNNILNTIGEFLKTLLITLPYCVYIMRNDTLAVWINVVSAIAFLLFVFKTMIGFVVYYYTSEEEWKKTLIPILEYLERNVEDKTK